MFAASLRARVALAVVTVAASLVAFPSPPAAANYPGANGKIAYVRLVGTETDVNHPDHYLAHIFVADPDGTNEQQVTTEAKRYSSLDWSADGTKLAFEIGYGPLTSYTSEIWVMNFDGTGLRRVSPAGASRHNPSWSPDGRYLAVDDAQSIYRIDTEAGHEQQLKAAEETTVSCLGQEEVHPVYFVQPAWSPDGGRIAMIRYYELPPVQNMDSCDPNVFFKYDLAVMGAGGGEETLLTDDPETNRGSRFDALPDWSPDGSMIVFQRSATARSDIGVAVVPSAGGTVVQLTTFGARPRWSPDGTTILFARDADQNGRVELWTMNPADGTDLEAVLQNDRSFLYQDWQPTTAGNLEVTLNAFTPGGTNLDGIIGMASVIDVELTIENPGEEDVSGFRFAGNAPLVVDDRSTGGVEILSGPTPAIPPELTLEPGEEVTFSYEVRTTAEGLVAAHTKATATDARGRPVEDVHSLKLLITDGVKMTDALGTWVQLQMMNQFLQFAQQGWYQKMAGRGRELADRMSAVFTPEERRRWFGSEQGLPLTPFDFALGALRSTAPEMIAALVPKNDFRGHTADDYTREYQETFKAEVGKGVSEWVDNWASLGSGAKNALKRAYGEALMTSFVIFGTATPEEVTQFNTRILSGLERGSAAYENFVNRAAHEVRTFTDNGAYLKDALDQSIVDTFNFVRDNLWEPETGQAFPEETRARQALLALASSEPMRFQREWAKRDARLVNLVMPLVLDTLAGGGIARVGRGARDLVVRGRGAAVIRAGEAAGVLNDSGNVIDAPRTALNLTDSSAAHGVPQAHVAEIERTGGFLENLEGATLIQSSDAGHVWELPNLGGVPERTLDVKASFLADLEAQHLARTGERIELAEVVKTSSPLTKAGGRAKTELTPFKTGKPEMLPGGAPREALGEANVWTSPDHPADLPGFDDLPHIQQQKAIKEWNLANERWDEFHDPEPGSKAARMKECIGSRNSVPLDVNADGSPRTFPGGIQRWVEAEYAIVEVTEGSSRAKLIRAKYYRTYEIDTTRGNRVVNSRVVINEPVAVPQIPDPDAVALAKVIGRTEDGRPILAPLSGAAEKRIVQSYIDKSVKAGFSEHGVTLNMFDATASQSGYLLPKFGVGFLPETPGLAFLERIAPHVARGLIPRGATAAEATAIIRNQYDQMVQLVQSSGGFGQHAVVVTSDSRYLGAVNFADW